MCRMKKTARRWFQRSCFFLFPIPSMYDIFTYIWLIFMVNVGKYPIHGSYGFGSGIRQPKSNIDLDTKNDVVFFKHPYV